MCRSVDSRIDLAVSGGGEQVIGHCAHSHCSRRVNNVMTRDPPNGECAVSLALKHHKLVDITLRNTIKVIDLGVGGEVESRHIDTANSPTTAVCSEWIGKERVRCIIAMSVLL